MYVHVMHILNNILFIISGFYNQFDYKFLLKPLSNSQDHTNLLYVECKFLNCG